MASVATFVGRVTLAWLVIVVAAFLLVRALPGDPALLFLARGNVAADEAIAAELRASWGLAGSLGEQLAAWFGAFIRFDWGHSIMTGEPILTEIASRLPWSVAIGFGGLAIALAVGAQLGFEAAVRPDGVADRLTRALAVSAQAVPAFAVGLGLLWLFAVELRWIKPLSGSTLERAALPILLVALFSVGAVARVCRAAFLEVASSPFFMTALAKGFSYREALSRHGRQHAALTMLAAFAPELGWVIGGTIVAEVVFSVPGLSDYLVEAVRARDYAALQASIAAIGLWIIIGLEVARLVRQRLEPRQPLR